MYLKNCYLNNIYIYIYIYIYSDNKKHINPLFVIIISQKYFISPKKKCVQKIDTNKYYKKQINQLIFWITKSIRLFFIFVLLD